jgi:hypothetical protein
LGLVRTHSREKHTAEPVQFGILIASFGPFDQDVRPSYRFKSFGGTIRAVQRFSLERQVIGMVSIAPVAIRSSIPPSIHARPSAASPLALRAQPRRMAPAASQ